MIDNPAIMVLSGSERGETSHSSTLEITDVELDILGQPVRLRIGVADVQASLADIVPLARTLSTKISDAVVKKMRQEGDNIPCRKGCSTCCYYLVPVLVPEAFRLREEILVQCASQKRSMQRACLLVARHILKHKLPKLFIDQAMGTSDSSSIDANIMSNWYKSLNLPCAFLCNGLCGIYEQRPLAFRALSIFSTVRPIPGPVLR